MTLVCHFLSLLHPKEELMTNPELYYRKWTVLSPLVEREAKKIPSIAASGSTGFHLGFHLRLRTYA